MVGGPAEAQKATKKKALTNQERSRPDINVALDLRGKFLQMFGGDAGELRFFMNPQNTDATLQNNFEKGHCDAHPCVFSSVINCVAWIPAVCLKWVERS